MTTEIIDVQFPGGKRVDVRVGEFLIKTDQSLKYGGGASAPEPFALFLASIASCAGIFALGFCQKRELSTEGLDLKMVCERDEKNIMIVRMTLKLTLPEGFPDKYREGIVRAMDLCAVKKHIKEAPEFFFELV
ncbi:MAG: OsmC family protein [Chromatiaceae bacterium]|nr:OsmC family protein [Chromatiaceae bacterium]MCP5408849.1 OsmC family protein [Chromatiaceae bacterium]MCP5445044.1 OsmC family protein [Chromatiaceae bacterium]